MSKKNKRSASPAGIGYFLKNLPKWNHVTDENILSKSEIEKLDIFDLTKFSEFEKYRKEQEKVIAGGENIAIPGNLKDEGAVKFLSGKFPLYVHWLKSEKQIDITLYDRSGRFMVKTEILIDGSIPDDGEPVTRAVLARRLLDSGRLKVLERQSLFPVWKELRQEDDDMLIVGCVTAFFAAVKIAEGLNYDKAIKMTMAQNRELITKSSFPSGVEIIEHSREDILHFKEHAEKTYSPANIALVNAFHENLPAWGRYAGSKFYTVGELEGFDLFNVVNGEGNAELFTEYIARSEKQVREFSEITIAQPPLNNGVMKVVIGDYAHFIRWKILDRGLNYFKATIDAYTAYPYRFVCRFIICSDEIEEFVNNPRYESAETVMAKLLKSKLPKCEKEKLYKTDLGSPDLDDYAVSILKSFIVGMELFSDLLEDDNLGERIPAEHERVSVKTSFKKDGEGRRRVIYLNGVSVECARENSGVAIRRGVMVRTCAAWGVRGHYRHYQNGKIIYIAPFEKGRERNTDKVRGKEYKVR